MKIIYRLLNLILKKMHLGEYKMNTRVIQLMKLIDMGSEFKIGDYILMTNRRLFTIYDGKILEIINSEVGPLYDYWINELGMVSFIINVKDAKLLLSNAVDTVDIVPIDPVRVMIRLPNNLAYIIVNRDFRQIPDYNMISPTFEYCNIHEDEYFMDIIKAKTSQGSRMYTINNYTMSLYPSLIKVNKGEKIDLRIYDESTLSFVGRFTVYKKNKNIIEYYIRFLRV